MNNAKKILVVLPMLALLFGCKKKTYDKNLTNNESTKRVVSTTKKNNSGLCHYEFIDYNGTILLANDVTKGTTISESIIPKPSREVEGEYFYYFTGWDKEVNRTINNDVTYTAQYEKLKIPYEINDNKVYFGSYPQTLVTDNALKTTLNTSAKLPSTNTNWISYNYYDDNSKSDYMWYIDIDTNNDSAYDYRGVYFTKYRPLKVTFQANEDESNIDENGFEKEEVYWFKYEIVEWNILKNSDGSMLLLSNLVLDSQEFYPDHNNVPFKHNSSEGYVNTYKLSEIRKWLNNEFYNTAFNNIDKKIMLLSDFSTREHVQTGTKSSSCKDYIYLLDDNEVSEYFPVDSNRVAKTSDYAKIQGVSVSDNDAVWGLRTPSSASPSLSSTAIMSQFVGFSGTIFDQYTDYTDIGVRPCLLVKA